MSDTQTVPAVHETRPADGRHTAGVAGRTQSVPHTQVHWAARRTLENLQDVIASLLIVLLFGLSLRVLWSLARSVVTGDATPSDLLSQIMFVLILTELYRLLIFYLREHRVSVALAVEVALVSTLREVMLRGAHEFDATRMMAVSLLLVVLGGLLAAERWMGRGRNGVCETDAC
jgi:uncharacterized membrane protein (DUF373 family)